VIVEGDMVVLDFGGLKHGYGSDTTRTVHVGEPTAEKARCTTSSVMPNKPASRQCAPESRARRSTGFRAQ
jgi:Xaa-Pro aminopeptidase